MKTVKNYFSFLAKEFLLSPLMQRMSTRYANLKIITYLVVLIILLANSLNTGQNEVSKLPHVFIMVNPILILGYIFYNSFTERVVTKDLSASGMIGLTYFLVIFIYALITMCVWDILGSSSYQLKQYSFLNLFGLPMVIAATSIIINWSITISRWVIVKRRDKCINEA
ncbi:hypothetical protein [Acetobacterium wieringae]|uniref:Uncharacterized protein n=1 Tax=Acetobacterium wieringae TaxID=52694 RepID=A0A1F2PJG0_9FIRM|nr:hypothetical protein [Acetobacterium wieringae]OFV71489.1 hypothetical protein ACWI_09890 [Acetobacterium wieringae]